MGFERQSCGSNKTEEHWTNNENKSIEIKQSLKFCNVWISHKYISTDYIPYSELALMWGILRIDCQCNSLFGHGFPVLYVHIHACENWAVDFNLSKWMDKHLTASQITLCQEISGESLL